MASLVTDELLFDHIFRKERIFRDRENPLDFLDDSELYRSYRFTRQGILFLIQLLTNDISRGTQRSHSLPNSLVVLTENKIFCEYQPWCLEELLLFSNYYYNRKLYLLNHSNILKFY